MNIRTDNTETLPANSATAIVAMLSASTLKGTSAPAAARASRAAGVPTTRPSGICIRQIDGCGDGDVQWIRSGRSEAIAIAEKPALAPDESVDKTVLANKKSPENPGFSMTPRGFEPLSPP